MTRISVRQRRVCILLYYSYEEYSNSNSNNYIYPQNPPQHELKEDRFNLPGYWSCVLLEGVIFYDMLTPTRA